MNRIRLFLIVIVSAGAGALASALYFRTAASRTGGGPKVVAATGPEARPVGAVSEAAHAAPTATTAAAAVPAMPVRPKFKMLTRADRDAILKQFEAEHPGYQAAQEAMRKRWLKMRYGNLSRLLGVDRGTADKLLTLLDERNQTSGDVRDVMSAHGVKPGGADYDALVHEQQGEIDAQIQQMLSPDQYKMLQLAPGIQSSTQLLTMVSTMELDAGNQALTPDQLSKATMELATHHTSNIWGGKPAAVTGPNAFLTADQVATLASVSAYLTPDQVAALKDTWVTFQANNYYSRELSKTMDAAMRQ